MTQQIDRWRPGTLVLAGEQPAGDDAGPPTWVGCGWVSEREGSQRGVWVVAVGESELDAGIRLGGRVGTQFSRPVETVVLLSLRGGVLGWADEHWGASRPGGDNPAPPVLPAAAVLAAELIEVAGVDPAQVLVVPIEPKPDGGRPVGEAADPFGPTDQPKQEG